MKEFGPFTLIDRKRQVELSEGGKWDHIFTLISFEQDYEDIPDEEKPTDEELEERGDTKENFSRGCFEGCVGYHLVNVSEMFESTKPMPGDLLIADDDIWFGEDGLPEVR